MLKKELVKELEGCDLINERMMILQLKTAQEPLFAFEAYIPDSAYNKFPRKVRKSFVEILMEKLAQTEHTHIQKTLGNTV